MKIDAVSIVGALAAGCYAFVLPFFIGPWLWLASGLIFPVVFLLRRNR